MVPVQRLKPCCPQLGVELTGVVHDVADIDKLVVQLRNLVPGEAAVERRQIEAVDRGSNQCIDKFQVGQQFGLGVGGLGRRIQRLKVAAAAGPGLEACRFWPR